jgi:hypothetical protein
MPKPLDGKFYGTIFRHKDNQIEPPDSWIVFVARDDALLPTLQFYYEECERIGAEPAQLNAIHALIKKVAMWRQANPGKLKVPDVHQGELAW